MSDKNSFGWKFDRMGFKDAGDGLQELVYRDADSEAEPASGSVMLSMMYLITAVENSDDVAVRYFPDDVPKNSMSMSELCDDAKYMPCSAHIRLEDTCVVELGVTKDRYADHDYVVGTGEVGHGSMALRVRTKTNERAGSVPCDFFLFADFEKGLPTIPILDSRFAGGGIRFALVEDSVSLVRRLRSE